VGALVVEVAVVVDVVCDRALGLGFALAFALAFGLAFGLAFVNLPVFCSGAEGAVLVGAFLFGPTFHDCCSFENAG